MNVKLASLATTALLGVACEAQAQSAFNVLEIDNNSGCRMTESYTMAGRSAINFSIDQEITGEVFVMVQSYGWSRPAEDDLTTMGLIFYRPGSSERAIFVALAVPLGVELGTEEPGMLGLIEPERIEEFRSALSQSSAVRIMSRPRESEDDFDVLLDASLQGSAAATTRWDACVARVKRREDARLAAEARVAHVARDPFARTGDDE